jgi:hypothetical protein
MLHREHNEYDEVISVQGHPEPNNRCTEGCEQLPGFHKLKHEVKSFHGQDEQ